MKHKDIIIILIIVFVVLLGGLILYFYVHKPKSTTNTNTSTNTGGGPVSTPTPPSGYNASCPPEFPLSFGSSNDYVGQLQQYLLKADATCLPAGVDSVWGNDMENCVKNILGVDRVGCEMYFNSLGLN